MMSIIWTILIGFIVVVIAKFLMPGRDPKGCIITILLGIAGSLLFTFLGKLIGLYHEGETAGFIGAVIGAMLILLIYRMIAKKKE